jgi:hypothetical protein
MQSLSTNVVVSIRVNNKDVAEYQHENRFYVEAKEGTEYSVHLKNNNPFRVKVVTTVDGISVISGKPASESETEAGYIMGAHESLDIKGYRVDDSNVAAFRFVKAEKGYAQAEKGLTGTTGVIGVRVFKEKVFPRPAPVPLVIREDHHHHHYPWIQYPAMPTVWYGNVTNSSLMNDGYMGGVQGCLDDQTNAYSSTTASNSTTQFNTVMRCCAPAAAQDATLSFQPANPFTLGSTFGSKVESRITEVSFLTECCLGTCELFYAPREGLISLGVDLTKVPKVSFPTAFPSKYAKPPSGWQG